MNRTFNQRDPFTRSRYGEESYDTYPGSENEPTPFYGESRESASRSNIPYTRDFEFDGGRQYRPEGDYDSSAYYYRPSHTSSYTRTGSGADYGRSFRDDYGYRANPWPSSSKWNKIRSMNFGKYVDDAYHFIREVANELGTNDLDKAARITRSVFHAIRDRISPDDATQFGQGLPMILKGVYFDQYDLSKTPVITRRKNDFLNFIREKDHRAAEHDFRTPNEVVRGLRSVFHVLENNMDQGQINNLKKQLHSEILELIEDNEHEMTR